MATNESGERLWWGIVTCDNHDPSERPALLRTIARKAAEAPHVEFHVDDGHDGPLAVTLRWQATDLDDALRRIRDVVSDPMEFSGQPRPAG